jgi:hypothetical protein
MHVVSHPDRVSKLLRLLSSDKDGEVLAAARAICRAVDIHALADTIERAFPADKSGRAGPDWGWWQVLAQDLLDHGVLFGDRERDFLRNMTRAQSEPTPGQEKWLNDIRNRKAAAA